MSSPGGGGLDWKSCFAIGAALLALEELLRRYILANRKVKDKATEVRTKGMDQLHELIESQKQQQDEAADKRLVERAEALAKVSKALKGIEDDKDNSSKRGGDGAAKDILGLARSVQELTGS